MPPSFLIGLVAATLIAVSAVRLRALTWGGAAAAAVVGAAVFWGGRVSWSLLLLFFFISSSALSRLYKHKDAVAQKGERRDALQVLANGGVPAVWAALQGLHPASVWLAPFAGAIAAATADTWATEIGSRNVSARLISSGRKVPAGTSGGVTLSGSAAGAAGALCIALAAGWAAGTWTPQLAVFVGGLAGNLADSLTGATIQERRFCPNCAAPTEQRVHAPCGTKTEVVGGIPHFDNDAVNALATVTGSLVALALQLL